MGNPGTSAYLALQTEILLATAGPFLAACYQGEMDKLTRLQDSPSVFDAALHKRDGSNNTPLHYAVLGNQPKVVALLLKYPKVLEDLFTENTSKNTPLQNAEHLWNLLETRRIDTPGEYTAEHSARQAKLQEILDLLRSAYAKHEAERAKQTLAYQVGQLLKTGWAHLPSLPSRYEAWNGICTSIAYLSCACKRRKAADTATPHEETTSTARTEAKASGASAHPTTLRPRKPSATNPASPPSTGKAATGSKQSKGAPHTAKAKTRKPSSALQTVRAPADHLATDTDSDDELKFMRAFAGRKATPPVPKKATSKPEKTLRPPLELAHEPAPAKSLIAIAEFSTSKKRAITTTATTTNLAGFQAPTTAKPARIAVTDGSKVIGRRSFAEVVTGQIKAVAAPPASTEDPIEIAATITRSSASDASGGRTTPPASIEDTAEPDFTPTEKAFIAYLKGLKLRLECLPREHHNISPINSHALGEHIKGILLHLSNKNPAKAESIATADVAIIPSTPLQSMLEAFAWNFNKMLLVFASTFDDTDHGKNELAYEYFIPVPLYDPMGLKIVVNNALRFTQAMEPLLAGLGESVYIAGTFNFLAFEIAATPNDLDLVIRGKMPHGDTPGQSAENIFEETYAKFVALASNADSGITNVERIEEHNQVRLTYLSHPGAIPLNVDITCYGHDAAPLDIASKRLWSPACVLTDIRSRRTISPHKAMEANLNKILRFIPRPERFGRGDLRFSEKAVERFGNCLWTLDESDFATETPVEEMIKQTCITKYRAAYSTVLSLVKATSEMAKAIMYNPRATALYGHMQHQSHSTAAPSPAAHGAGLR